MTQWFHLWEFIPYAKEENSISKRCLHPMFIAGLFTTAKTRKQPKGPSMDEWIKKMLFIYIVVMYAMEYDSSTRKKESKKQNKWTWRKYKQ